MLNDTAAVSSETDFTLENFAVADEDLPDFKDMPFEDIEELHLDHPGANDQEYRERELTALLRPRKGSAPGSIASRRVRPAPLCRPGATRPSSSAALVSAV